jgi:WAS protein family homolog 1
MIEIPVIGKDIRQDEVSIRALKTFEYLDNIVDQIFDRIDSRIAKNMKKIDEINTRLEKASEKIEKLKTSKKAIKIYSPARYPISEPPKIIPTFDKSFDPGSVNLHYKLDLPLEATDYKQYSDKLQFFHLKRARKSIPQKADYINNTKSINSLITFINNENLYLKDSKKLREKEIQPVERKEDDTTDFSRFSTMIKNKTHGENFHYLPSFNEAPEFEFPVDLPDLEGIANDISFSMPDEEIMFPSFRGINIVNDLPNVSDLIEAESSRKVSDENKVVEVKQDPVIAPPSIPVNIPLPPPIPSNFVPPPPPPPPMIPTSNETPKSTPLPNVDSARSNLMDAIRKAGGKAKLKSIPAADEQVPEQIKKKKPAAAPAMDLMSDLHEKLRLRRKGIAGSKEAKKEKPSILNKLSAIIPPPKKDDNSDSDSSSDTNDDDWN